jgi:hypothetical protein
MVSDHRRGAPQSQPHVICPEAINLALSQSRDGGDTEIDGVPHRTGTAMIWI